MSCDCGDGLSRIPLKPFIFFPVQVLANTGRAES